MKRVLLTGMSGVGKTSVIQRLSALGHRAVDLDDGWCEVTADGRQLWRLDAVSQLLATEGPGLLFVAGCEENMTVLVPDFDVVILLTASEKTILDRVAARSNNPYGQTAADRDRIRSDIRDVEPLLRRIAHHEVDTTQAIEAVVQQVLALVSHGVAPMPRDSR